MTVDRNEFLDIKAKRLKYLDDNTDNMLPWSNVAKQANRHGVKVMLNLVDPNAVLDCKVSYIEAMPTVDTPTTETMESCLGKENIAKLLQATGCYRFLDILYLNIIAVIRLTNQSHSNLYLPAICA